MMRFLVSSDDLSRHRTYLVHLTIVVSVESSKKWMAKLSIDCQGGPDLKNEKNKAQELDHLRNAITGVAGQRTSWQDTLFGMSYRTSASSVEALFRRGAPIIR